VHQHQELALSGHLKEDVDADRRCAQPEVIVKDSDLDSVLLACADFADLTVP
jgi:hypothetical protein